MQREEKQVARIFDAWALAGRGERMEAGHWPTGAQVLARMPRSEGTWFLDLGTGNGWAARVAAAKGYRAVGVDVSGGMLARARALEASVALVRCSFEALPFRDGAFARGFSMEALYYAHDVHGALKEAHRTLGPASSLDAVIDRYEENTASHDWPEQVGVAMHLLSESAWRAALQDAGFEDVRTERLRGEAAAEGSWQAREGSLHVSGKR